MVQVRCGPTEYKGVARSSAPDGRLPSDRPARASNRRQPLDRLPHHDAERRKRSEEHTRLDNIGPIQACPAEAGGENHGVTARARRAAGEDVLLIDPFSISGAYAYGHALNWLDTLDPDHPDVVSRAGTLADMLVVRSGFESEPHWNDTARDLLRGFWSMSPACLPSSVRWPNCARC
jgi:hypothetical protein